VASGNAFAALAEIEARLSVRTRKRSNAEVLDKITPSAGPAKNAPQQLLYVRKREKKQ
jgi:hypothetical protein